MPGASRTLLLLMIAGCGIPAIQAGQYLIVTHPSNGGWGFQDVESISVNGKEKLRSAPLPAATFDSKAIGHLAEVQLASFTVVRRAADGSIVGRAGEAGNWQALLPENTNSKTADPPRSCGVARRSRSSRTAKINRQRPFDSRTCMRSSPAATRPHRRHGLRPTLARTRSRACRMRTPFGRCFRFFPDAAKAFSEGPASKTISDFLTSSLLKHLQRWQGGDASILVLDESMALAAAADVAFPKDKSLAELSSGVRSIRKALDRKLAILRALDAGKQSDAFLIAYRDFEVYDKSFPDLAKARAAHMRLSAAAHVKTAQTLQASGDYMGAIRHLLIARWRDPSLTNRPTTCSKEFAWKPPGCRCRSSPKRGAGSTHDHRRRSSCSASCCWPNSK